MSAPITRYIDTDTGTLVISEHPDKVFISVAGGRSMFLDLKALDALLEEAWVIRRRLRGRSPSSP